MQTLEKGMEDEYELIQIVSWRDDYPDDARKALETLFQRYKVPLFKVLRKILGRRGVKEDDLIDLVTDTFFKVYNEKKLCTRTVVTTKNSFLNWLVEIAKNLFYDTRSENSLTVFTDYDEEEEDGQKIERIANTDPRKTDPVFPNEEIVVEYLQNLPEKKREILLAYYDYFVPGKKMPHRILSKLAKRFNTTEDYIRTLKNRELKTFENKLKDKVTVRN